MLKRLKRSSKMLFRVSVSNNNEPEFEANIEIFKKMREIQIDDFNSLKLFRFIVIQFHEIEEYLMERDAIQIRILQNDVMHTTKIRFGSKASKAAFAEAVEMISGDSIHSSEKSSCNSDE